MKSNQSSAEREFKKLKDDLEFCDMALEMSPDDDNSHYNKAEALRKLGEFDSSFFNQAMESYNKALELNPENILALCDRSKLHAKLGNKDLSFKDLVKLRELTINDKSVVGIYAKNTLKDLDFAESINKQIDQKLGNFQDKGAKPSINAFKNAAYNVVKEATIQKNVRQIEIEELRLKMKKTASDKEISDKEKQALETKLKDAELKQLQTEKALQDVLANQQIMMERITKNEVNIQDVKSATESINQRMDIVTNKVDSIEKSLSVFQSKIDESESDIKKLVDEFSHNHSKLEQVQSTLKNVIVTVGKNSKLHNDQIYIMQSEFDSKIKDMFEKSQNQNRPMNVDEIMQQLKDLSSVVERHDIEIKSMQKVLVVNEQQFKELNSKVENVTSKFELFGGKINIIEGDLNNQKTKIANIDASLVKANVYKKAEIEEGFKKLQQNDPMLYEYANKFYWTLSNYMLAYRAISTGMIKGQEDANSGMVAKIFDSVIGVFTSAISAIPMVGGIIGFIESTVGVLYKGYQSEKFNRKIEKMNNVISQYMLEEDLNLAVASAALNIATLKKDIIHGTSKSNLQGFDAAQNWFSKHLDKLMSKATNIKTIYNSQVSKLALEDVALFIGHIITSDKVLAKDANDPLDKSIVEVFNSDAIEKQLIEAQATDSHKKSSSCVVFAVTDIVYDNELLNHPDLFQRVAKLVGIDKAFELGAKFTKETLDNIEMSGNYDILFSEV